VRFLKNPKVVGVAACLCTALIPATATASSGGIGTGPGAPTTVPGAKAKLVNGKAIAPASAPAEVQEVIAAANRIRNKPYVYGGGHGSFKDDGYDCSGSVSYALHGGGLLRAPLDSSGLGKWGEQGAGSWITVYGAPSHAYMVVAGLRFDTSMTPGNGPSWSKSMRSTPESYRVRHPDGL
jgi:hypothetical protein